MNMIKENHQIKISPILLGLLFAVIQTSFVPTLVGSENLINLVGSLCFAYILTSNYAIAYEVAFFVGLFLDLISVGVVGFTPFGLTIFVLIYKYINGFYLRNSVSRTIYAFIMFVLLRFLSIGSIRLDSSIFISALLTALIGYFISLFIRKNYASEQKVNF